TAENDAGDAPAKMEMAEARRVGAGGESLPDSPDTVRRGDFFRERRRQSADSPIYCARFGKKDGRPSCAESYFDSLALAGNHAEGIGDSRAGTRRNGATVCR